MRGPKPHPVILSEGERTDLKQLVRRHSTPQQQALRARIILAAAECKNNSQIVRELDVCIDTVRHRRTRWLGLQAASLEDLPASGMSLVQDGLPRFPPSKPARWWRWLVSNPKNAHQLTFRAAKSLTKSCGVALWPRFRRAMRLAC